MANKRQKTSDAIEIVERVEKELYKKVRAYIAAARTKVYTVANEEMVKAYWNVELVLHETLLSSVPKSSHAV